MNTEVIFILSELSNELMIRNTDIYPEVNHVQSNNSELILRIEKIFTDVMKSIANGQAPHLTSVYHGLWNDIFFDESCRIKKKETSQTKKRRIDFGKPSSRQNFMVVIFLLAKVHKLLLTKTMRTRRELAYEHMSVFQSQAQVDRAMKDVCSLLCAAPWQLGVQASSKGLVVGPLNIMFADGTELNCNVSGGVLVPQNILEITSFECDAKCIFLVEKDAAFQKLLDEDILSRMAPCLLITGKGFPDVNTRLLICRLWQMLHIPTLALVDADPHGVEIMCVYRFGSLAMSSFSTNIACPAICWLGIHPTDIRRLGVDCTPMTNQDLRKAKQLLTRPYIINDPELEKQVRALLQGEVKAEVEGLSRFGQAYLTDAYLPRKLANREFL